MFILEIEDCSTRMMISYWQSESDAIAAGQAAANSYDVYHICLYANRTDINPIWEDNGLGIPDYMRDKTGEYY